MADGNETDRLLPFLSKEASVRPIVEAILAEGYYVWKGVMTDEECGKAIDDIWDFVQDTSNGRVQRHDPSSWYPKSKSHDDGDNEYDDPFPHTGYKSFSDMFQSNGAGWVLGRSVRELLAERVFEPLYNTRELHSSKEGFTFHRPTAVATATATAGASIVDPVPPQSWLDRIRAPPMVCSQAQKNESAGEHFDQASALEGLHTIQSLVALEDQEEGVDGHFLCWPQSHKLHQSLTKDIYRGKFSWIPLTDDEIVRIKQEMAGMQPHQQPQPRRVYLNKGDVLLWRSDLVHAAVPPTARTERFRAVAYTCMQPASLTPPSVYADKLQAYKQRQTGDHRPHVESWHTHRQTLCTTSIRHRRAFRCQPPLLTRRLAELYGLLPYPQHTREDIGSAIIRGVRFIDDHNTTSVPSVPTSLPCTDVVLETIDNIDLVGPDKYLGGVPSPCGDYVYGVPGTAKQVLCIHVKTGQMELIGPSFPGKLKWLRGVDIPSTIMMKNSGNSTNEYPRGCCLALPSNATSILKINPSTQRVMTFGQDVLEHPENRSSWSYHGGQLAESNGMVYAIPANAKRVLKICPRTEKAWVIGPSFGDGHQKWFGGILGSDKCIYGIPHNESGILKIDPTNDECTIIEIENHENQNSNTSVLDGNWKWHGGVAVKNKIYGYPNNADEVLVLNVTEQRAYTVGGGGNKTCVLQSGRHRIPQDGRYKYLGGAATLDGNYVYLFPCDAEQVLKVDTSTDELSLVGPFLLDGENKFQNGFAAAHDGCIYGIPQRALGILRLDPRIDAVDILPCEDLIAVKDKFEGGVLAGDGNIYCMPLRAKTCVKIRIPQARNHEGQD